MNAAKLFFSFHGRTGRGPFWIVVLVLAAVGLLAGLSGSPGAMAAAAVVSVWPFLAVSVKRLRDMNRSPLLAVIPLATAALVWGVGIALLTFGLFASAILLAPNLFGEGFGVLAGIIVWLSVLPQIVFLLWLGLKKGVAEGGGLSASV